MSTIAQEPIVGLTCRLAEEMTEAVLLPSWEALQMERRARSQGLTVGQLIRTVIRDYLSIVPENH